MWSLSVRGGGTVKWKEDELRIGLPDEILEARLNLSFS